MDIREQLILIRGHDQTDAVASFRFSGETCEIVYTRTPDKIYRFQRKNVEVLPLRQFVAPEQVLVSIKGQSIGKVQEILDFGSYYRIAYNGMKHTTFRKSDVQLQTNCLSESQSKEIFQYFKETAAAVSLTCNSDAPYQRQK